MSWLCAQKIWQLLIIIIDLQVPGYICCILCLEDSHFYFLFLCLIPFPSTACLTVVTKISSILLKRNDDYGYLCDLVLFCSCMKNVEHFISKYVDWCGIFAGIIYQNEDPRFCSYFLTKIFKRRIVSFSRCFLPIQLNYHMVFLLSSVNVLCYSNCVLNEIHSSSEKPKLEMIYVKIIWLLRFIVFPKYCG